MTPDELTDLVAEGDLAAVRAALDAGTDPNLPDANGMTALEVAAGRRNLALVEVLLENGADPNPSSGTAPLYLARDLALITLLLNRGADSDWQTDKGETALTFAAHDGSLDAVEILLAGGADPSHPSTVWPPLFYAAMAGHLDVVQALADGGADLLRVHDDRTALHGIAVEHARWNVADFLLARAPGAASVGSVDPAGIAREKGESALADRIAARRLFTK